MRKHILAIFIVFALFIPFFSAKTVHAEETNPTSEEETAQQTYDPVMVPSPDTDTDTDPEVTLKDTLPPTDSRDDEIAMKEHEDDEITTKEYEDYALRLEIHELTDEVEALGCLVIWLAIFNSILFAILMYRSGVIEHLIKHNKPET